MIIVMVAVLTFYSEGSGRFDGSDYNDGFKF